MKEGRKKRVREGMREQSEGREGREERKEKKSIEKQLHGIEGSYVNERRMRKKEKHGNKNYT